MTLIHEVVINNLVFNCFFFFVQALVFEIIHRTHCANYVLRPCIFMQNNLQVYFLQVNLLISAILYTSCMYSLTQDVFYLLAYKYSFVI